MLLAFLFTVRFGGSGNRFAFQNPLSHRGQSTGTDSAVDEANVATVGVERQVTELGVGRR